MIHCLKTNLHCHTDHLADPPGEWHPSAYPAAAVVDLFAANGFDALGITEHAPQTSGPALAAAARRVAERGLPLLLVPGREIEIANCHVLELADAPRPALRVLNHPVRTKGLAELAATIRSFRAEHGIAAVELDMMAADNPAVARAYEHATLPVICNSDFHSNLFDAANHFTVYLCRERSVAAILEALRKGDFVGFYPDKSTRRMRHWSGGSAMAEAWIRDDAAFAFHRAFEDFLYVAPPISFRDMGVRDIEAFHHTRGLLLTEGDLRLLLLPDRGARIAGLWTGGCQVVDPILNAALDVDSSAEVFEAGDAPYRLVESGPGRATFERTLSDRPDFAGVTYRKSYRLDSGSVVITSARRNASSREVRLYDNLRFRFLKEFGDAVSYDVRAPTASRLGMPVNYGGVCTESAAHCDLTLHGAGYALDLTARDARLERLCLWSRPTDGYALVILRYRPVLLPAGASVPEYAVRLTPRRTA
jgi:hypothetical protein